MGGAACAVSAMGLNSSTSRSFNGGSAADGGARGATGIRRSDPEGSFSEIAERTGRASSAGISGSGSGSPNKAFRMSRAEVIWDECAIGTVGVFFIGSTGEESKTEGSKSAGRGCVCKAGGVGSSMGTLAMGTVLRIGKGVGRVMGIATGSSGTGRLRPPTPPIPENVTPSFIRMFGISDEKVLGPPSSTKRCGLSWSRKKRMRSSSSSMPRSKLMW